MSVPGTLLTSHYGGSMAEWIASTCGSLSQSERDTMLSMGVKVLIQKNASPREKELYDHLRNKDSEIYSCGMDKFRKARHAIKEIKTSD
jgi:hypothetical protein